MSNNACRTVISNIKKNPDFVKEWNINDIHNDQDSNVSGNIIIK